MRRLSSVLTFLFFLIIFIELRFRLPDKSAPYSSFVFLMLLTVLAGIYWGFGIGLLILFALSFGIAQYFLTPGNITQLTSSDMQYIALFMIEGIIILFFMTLLKKGKEQEHELRERFQIILSSIGDSVIATDVAGNIKYMNAAAQQITGWHFRDARKKQLPELLKMENKEDSDKYFSSINNSTQKGQVYTLDKPISFRNKKGKLIDIQDTVAPLCNMQGQRIGMVLIFRDVTDRREMEEQKEVLLGSISHELKNYITSIEGYAHIVRKKLQKQEDEDLKSFADKLYHKVETMRTVIISMLDLSKLRVGKLDMQIQEFDLKDIIKSIVTDYQGEMKNNIIIKNSISLEVKGDKTKIGQVLTNLLNNAMKYSPQDRDIHIITSKKDGEAIVGVRDFGNGIQKEKIEKIFKPFYRAVSEIEKNSISGSGLGLYISSEIINQHGGRLWVHSELGKGSTFYFALPLIQQVETYTESSEDTSLLNRIKMILQFKAQSA